MKYLNKDDYANSYEAAMKFEFDSMKKAYLQKIELLTKDCDQIKRSNLEAQVKFILIPIDFVEKGARKRIRNQKIINE